jgi:hypothetical protein
MNRRITDSGSTLAIERTFRFMVQESVQSAALEGKDLVCGTWTHDRTRFLTIGNEFSILEDFVNWSSAPAEIVRFTKVFGPLEDRFKMGGRFQFKIKRWRYLQKEFQRLWFNQMLLPSKPIPNVDWEVLQTATGETFNFFQGQLEYVVSTLRRFLVLGLYACPRWRLKMCHRPECSNPYFIAARRGQRYCGEPCANAAQREWKRRWWKDTGSIRRSGERTVR